ncbi:hypothetical protein [Pseudomonas sp. O230]|uniref:hypothetical protein n=1 Tax=Pseudomonas sp. O230 TaxID=3159450 RepID=UPI00387B4F96
MKTDSPDEWYVRNYVDQQPRQQGTPYGRGTYQLSELGMDKSLESDQAEGVGGVAQSLLLGCLD